MVKNHQDRYPYLNLSQKPLPSTNSRQLILFGNCDWSMNPETPRWSDGQKCFSKYTFNTLQKLDTKLGHFTKLKLSEEILHKNHRLQQSPYISFYLLNMIGQQILVHQGGLTARNIFLNTSLVSTLYNLIQSWDTLQK